KLALWKCAVWGGNAGLIGWTSSVIPACPNRPSSLSTRLAAPAEGGGIHRSVPTKPASTAARRTLIRPPLLHGLSSRGVHLTLPKKASGSPTRSKLPERAYGPTRLFAPVPEATQTRAVAGN